MKRVFSLAVAVQMSMINMLDNHRDRLTKNPVGLNRRSGLEIMGIELERHHRVGMLNKIKAYCRSLSIKFWLNFWVSNGCSEPIDG
jgi:hypothetical protein